MTVDFRIFGNALTMLLNYFMRVRNVTECNNRAHFDIEITREDDFHSIYVTNCDCGAGDSEEVFVALFDALGPRIELNCYFEAITAFVRLKNDEEWAHVLQYPEKDNKCLIIRRRLDTKESRRFEHMKEYQCFMLKCILGSEYIEEFRKYLSRRIQILVNLHKSSFEAKWTFHCGERMIYQNHVELTKTAANCKLISSAMNSILNRSQNCQFRTRCFELLGVRYSDEIEEAVMSKLLALIPENRQGKKRNYKLSATIGVADKVIVSSDKIYEEQMKNDESLKSSAPIHDQATEIDKENNQGNGSVTSPIFMTWKGRRAKRAKFYNGMDNMATKNEESLESTAPIHDQAMEIDKESNQANGSVTSPKIMTLKGRRVKRTTFFDEINNITKK